MDKKTWTAQMLPTRDPSQDKRLTQTESEGLETNFPSKRTGKKRRGSNTHIRQNRLPKKGHKERPRIHQEDINCKYICSQHRNTQIHKENLGRLQDIESTTIIVGDFNTPLSKMDRSSKQNINKDIVSLNNAPDEIDLSDIYRTFHPKEAKYIFFSNAHGTFSKIDYLIGHETSLNKLKKVETIPFSRTTRA